MRISTVVMIAFAVVFGLLAVFVAQTWLNNQAELRMKSLEAHKQPVNARTIVVASKPLRFGNEVTAQALREVPWPEEALPSGAFASTADLLTGGRRVVLTAIEANEPILATKITGAGQRATLSALLHEGMKAVTIRVNDVEGVAGFVLPGDRVDVMLSRPGTAPTTDVVVQDARVLAVDQIADERVDKPSVVKAVTLEVEINAAQKIALAALVGNLSLVLRKAGEAMAEVTRRVTLLDLQSPSLAMVRERPKGNGSLATVTVTRASTKQEYSVPAEKADGHIAASAGEHAGY
ncbi:MAG: Flp pilus assembly protein CpaB [Xanthobacteraceae bacterium]